MKYPYLKVLKNLLYAISEDNENEVRDFANEICNLVMDRIAIDNIESEVAGDLLDELHYYNEND